MRFRVVVLVVMVVAVGGVMMAPRKLVLPDDGCPSRNSCHYNGTDLTILWDKCQCDPVCNLYADCCYDSEFRNASQQILDDAREFKCDVVGNDKIYLRIGCPEGWTDAAVEERCVGGGVNADPVSGLPVTSNATGYTYPNYYCAICNEDIVGLRMWNGKLSCGSVTQESLALNELVLQNNTWGVVLPESSDFHTCSLVPQMPEDIRYLTRSCSLSIHTCSEDWQDEVVESLCQSYTAVVYNGIERYRNPHCALCNNHQYECVSGIHIRLRPPTVSFALIFDFTDPSGSNLVGSSSPCNTTQVWDPFFKRCRSIVCPKPNQDYRYGKCVTLRDANTMEDSEPTATPTTASTTVTERLAVTVANNESNIDNFTNIRNDHITSSNNTTTTPNNITGTITNNTITPNNLTTTPDPPSTTDSESFLNTTLTSKSFPEDKHPIIFPVDPTETPTTLSQDGNSSTSPSSTNPSFDSSTHSTATNTDAAFPTNASSEFAECYKFILLEGEFITFPNDSVHVAEYGLTYNPGEYKRIREGVQVCRPQDTTSSRKFSSAFGWVSLAGLGLSCTCLLLHLAAFSLLPELRNLSGRNLASLCLALLAAYITFLVNMLVRPNRAGCVTLAAAMYYFFVTSFTWMSVIAFDVWYTFRLTQRHLRVSSGDQWHRFIAYSLYGWLVPAAATLVLVLVDQLEPQGVPQEFLPRLGRTWCWFSHRKSLLAFFAAPMVVIIVINCIFFVNTAAIITQTTSTAAAVTARGNHPRGQYKLYLRLAVLMGFTWLSGIAAGFLDLEALWYVFVVLNTLQGVYIFIGFTFRTRVGQGVGDTCNKLLQRGISIVTRRPSPQDIRAFEMSHTPDATSYSPNTSLEAY